MSVQKQFTTNLKMWLKLRNLRPIDLAKKSGVPKSAISKMLAGGSNPSLKTLEKLARALRLQPGFLIYEQYQPTPAERLGQGG